MTFIKLPCVYASNEFCLHFDVLFISDLSHTLLSSRIRGLPSVITSRGTRRQLLLANERTAVINAKQAKVSLYTALSHVSGAKACRKR